MKGNTYTAVIQTEEFKNCNSRRLGKCMGELSSADLVLQEFITPNVLVFEAKNAKRAGKRIEQWLFKNFKIRGGKR